MTEEELFELLKKQEEAATRKATFFIHYDPITKKVVNFRNYLDKNDLLPSIEISEVDLDVPLDKFNIADYRVISKDGKSKLEKYIEEGISLSKIDDFIYEVPKIESNRSITSEEHLYDLMIEQNNPEEEFRIKLSSALREKFSLQSIGTQVMCVYVTAASDPNILYQTLELPLKDLVKYESYDLPFKEFRKEDVNIYALKYFENYLHVVIK